MEFSPFEKRLVSLVEKSKSRGRSRIRNALNHLEHAWTLRTVDLEMAAFRAITAEEEAASGLMYTLQEIGYVNSEKLRPKYHWHKSAVTPFIIVLSLFFEDFLKANGIQPIFQIKTEGEAEYLSMGIPIRVEDKPLLAQPIPPLNFGITVDGKPKSYREELDRFLAERGASSMETHAKELANLRNKILYAADSGYLKIAELQDEFFAIRKRRVFAMLCAYLFVYPYSERQPFVQHCLDTFLVILGSMSNPYKNEEV